VYFDKANGNPGALDAEVQVGVYRKSDNQLMDVFVLPLTQEVPIPYTNPKCASQQPNLQTSRPTYVRDVQLQASRYDHPSGYYFVYDRCCRNNIIENIRDPEGAGMLFYLEFPAVVRNGAPFINSSPQLFPPLSDFACAGQPFYFDFSGSDVDGDSLVYSLSTPLNGFSTADAPNPGPAPGIGGVNPYPTVQFLAGYNVNNMVRGTPSLSIDQTGYLTLTPSETGLFVFAIKCEEFRDGVKIGEVRRDFQMLVVNCPDNQPPVITVSNQDPSDPPYIAGDTIRYEQGISENPCYLLNIFDNNTRDTVDVRLQPITQNSANGVTLRPLNRPSLTNVALSVGQSLQAELCLPDCGALVDEVFQFRVIVGDRSCSLPLLDTAVFTLLIESNPNTPPTLETSLGGLGADGCYTADILVGDTLRFDITGLDPDQDSLRLLAFSTSVDLAAEGIVFNTIETKSAINAALEWIPTCENLGNNNAARSFDLQLVVEDYWRCGVRSRDTICVTVNLDYVPEPNEPPGIVPDGLTDLGNQSFVDTVYLGNDLTFDLLALDPEIDSMRLEVFPQGFSLEEFRMSFPSPLTGRGSLSGSFSWTPTCEDLRRLQEGVFQETFDLLFVTTDYNDCFRQDKDSISVRLVLIFTPDENQAPVIGLEEADQIAFDPVLRQYCDTLTVGEALSLNFWATDLDTAEMLFLDMIPQGFDFEELGIQFETQTGTVSNGADTLRASFFWQPACDALATLGGQTLTLDFISRDENTCRLTSSDTVRLKIVVLDLPRPPVADFPNAFSPNGDGRGDAFVIADLPIDNCADAFVGIAIYDRWGRKVFESQERDFAWDGEGHPPGVYYYRIEYLNSEYKGTVTLFRGETY
jgi:gliding motility-associated-like protein